MATVVVVVMFGGGLKVSEEHARGEMARGREREDPRRTTRC